MKICDEWRGFDVPPAGYKLDNELKLLVYQSFAHNLNSIINQVSASDDSLVKMPPTPSRPPSIPPFVIIDSRTCGHSFGSQVTRHQRSDNSVSSLYINGRPYNGPVYDDKGNRIT